MIVANDRKWHDEAAATSSCSGLSTGGVAAERLVAAERHCRRRTARHPAGGGHGPELVAARVVVVAHGGGPFPGEAGAVLVGVAGHGGSLPRVGGGSVGSVAAKRRADFSPSNVLWEAGHEVVVGIDEVGRGPGPGRSWSGAAVLPRDRRVYKVRDSKLLTEAEREALFDRMAEWCVAWAVGHASQAECDELGMSAAQRLAARRAIDGLGRGARRRCWSTATGTSSARGTTRTHRQGRRHLPVDRGGVDPGQGHPRPASCGPRPRTTPATTFDRNKGYPCPRHKVALAGLRPDRRSTAARGCSWTACRAASGCCATPTRSPARPPSSPDPRPVLARSRDG